MINLGKESRDLLIKGINQLANAVKVTLGPKGKNVVLFNQDGKAYVTKDGISVAKHIFDENPVINAGMQFVREAAAKTAQTAGDSTTTATILTQKLVNSGVEFLDNGGSYREVKSMFSEAQQFVTKYILKHSKKCTVNELYNVALTSTNNDKELSTIIAEAFKKVGSEGLVSFEQTESPTTTVDFVEGMQFNNGIYNNSFVTNKRKQIAEYENCNVVLYDGTLKDIDVIISAMQTSINNSVPLIVIANDFADKAITQMYVNFTRGKCNVLPIKTPGFADARNEYLNDLRAITGATIIKNRVVQYADIGKIKKIVSNMGSTTLFYDYDTLLNHVLFDERIEELKGRIETVDDDKLKEQYKKQLSRLLGKIAVIKVGGTTEIEIREKYDRVEDAVCACYAALELGICPGSGRMYLNCISKWNDLHKQNDIPYNFAISALNSILEQQCANSGWEFNNMLDYYIGNNKNVGFDFLNEKSVNLYKVGIIDSSKALIEAYSNAISVALIVLSTECVID